MSARTIAVDSQVYERMVQAKREGESFSKTIDRLLRGVDAAHTGRDVLRALEEVVALPEEDAAVMLAVAEENRAGDRRRPS